MSGVNKVILVGNVGRDPEIRHLEGGVTVARFSLATSEVYKNKEGQRVEQTEWHNVVVWRGLADVAEKLVHKGSMLYVEGKLRTRSWEDKDHNKRYTTEIVADVMTLLNRKTDDNNVSGSYGTPAAGNDYSTSPDPHIPPADGTDDLPF
jgi:single-strand DNA-binding protein